MFLPAACRRLTNEIDSHYMSLACAILSPVRSVAINRSRLHTSTFHSAVFNFILNISNRPWMPFHSAILVQFSISRFAQSSHFGVHQIRIEQTQISLKPLKQICSIPLFYVRSLENRSVLPKWISRGATSLADLPLHTVDLRKAQYTTWFQ